MKAYLNELPDGYWLGRWGMARVYHLVRTEPSSSPLCGSSCHRYFSWADGDDHYQLCPKCAVILRRLLTRRVE